MWKVFAYLLSAFQTDIVLLKSQTNYYKTNKIAIRGLFVFPLFIFNKIKHVFFSHSNIFVITEPGCYWDQRASTRQTIQTITGHQKLLLVSLLWNNFLNSIFSDLHYSSKQYNTSIVVRRVLSVVQVRELGGENDDEKGQKHKKVLETSPYALVPNQPRRKHRGGSTEKITW